MKLRIRIFMCALALLCLPGVAFGAATAVSFGAKAYPRFPCTCTKGTVWYLVIPPVSTKAGAGTVAYVVGSQAKSKYNLPYSTQVLGIYNPFVKNLCWMGVVPYCWLMPTNGTILPEVGSSI